MTYLVVWTLRDEEKHEFVDDYKTFMKGDYKKPKKSAKRFYKRLIKEQGDLYTASVTKVIKSTDY